MRIGVTRETKIESNAVFKMENMNFIIIQMKRKYSIIDWIPIHI